MGIYIYRYKTSTFLILPSAISSASSIIMHSVLFTASLPIAPFQADNSFHRLESSPRLQLACFVTALSDDMIGNISDVLLRSTCRLV